MHAFFDPIDQSYLDREYRRRQLLAAIQGWLRTHSAPRQKTALLLLICAVVACLASHLLWLCGFHNHATTAAAGILLGWPVFALGFLKFAKREFPLLDLGEKAADYRRATELHEENENAPTDSLLSENVRIGIQSGLRQGGAGTLIVIVFLILVTAGCWLIWNLIRSSPALLSETILDCFIHQAEPKLFRRLQWYDGRRNLIAVSGFHLVSFAVVIYLLVFFIEPLMSLHH